MDDSPRKWYRLDCRSLSNLLVVCTGILLYLGLTHLPQVKAAVKQFLDVFTPFIAGFAIAYLLNTPTNFFEREIYSDCAHKRILAIITVYVIALLALMVLLQLILPQVGASIMSLASNLSYYLDNLNQMVLELMQRFNVEWEGLSGIMADYQLIIRKVTDFLASSMPDLLNFGIALGNGLITALTALISSIYMLAGKDRLIKQLKKLIYALFPTKGVNHILSVSSRANTVFVGFINGKILDSAIIGVLCFVLTVIFRIPYAVLISVIIGVTNIVPFFGPIIGAVPSVMLLVIVDPWAALRFLALIIALQQFDGNILGPKILGDSTGLSAIWVLVAIVVGGGLFGFAGMLLGVPTFAVLYALTREWTDRRLAQKGIKADGTPMQR